jgi:hypothetical protein
MARMVADSTAIVLRIWGNRQHFDEMAIAETTLTLVPEDYLHPYEMPLGDSSE